MAIIGIVTDFGNRGMHYVAEMKGVALQINPDLQIVDIIHSIAPFSIIEAAYVLYITYSTFPKNTIFVCVVDPGVGSERDIVAIQTIDNYILIGPDNGIFSYFSKNNLISFITTVTESEFFYKPYSDTIKLVNEHNSMSNEIFFGENQHFDKSPEPNLEMINPISSTFHGRDIMIPVASHLSCGLDIFSIGEPKEDVVSLPNFEPEYSEKEMIIKGMIQYVDDFGNLITNIPNDEFHYLTHKKFTKFQLNIRNTRNEAITAPYFAENPPEKILVIEGSSSFLEICQNQRKAVDTLNAKVGDPFQIKFLE